jgi:hypothetical protein
MASDLEYDIELDELRYSKDEVEKSNTETIERTLVKIQELMRDIDRRLKEAGV